MQQGRTRKASLRLAASQPVVTRDAAARPDDRTATDPGGLRAQARLRLAPPVPAACAVTARLRKPTPILPFPARRRAVVSRAWVVPALALAAAVALAALALESRWLLAADIVAAAATAVTALWLQRRAGAARGIAGYTLIERLETGGMGEVWRARHLALEREVAIKLIRPELLARGERDHPAWIERDFAHEARATAQLASPHTVRIHDFGRSGDGTLYYAMELLDGMTLEALVRRAGPVAPERVAFILEQVCASLGEAHARGLVHGDIKPRNIQLGVRAGAHDFATVLDFGLSRAADDRRAPRPNAAQRVCGTPDFLAPEIYREPTAARPAADLYALGCVAYRLLTGAHVFEADTTVALIRLHVEVEPARPSTRVAQAIPAALEDLVMALLAKHPADRPRDAAEVARRLRATGLAARWTEARAANWWRGVTDC